MTPDELAAIPRKDAREIIEGPPHPLGLVLAVEQELNLEWWRGYHAARRRDLPPIANTIDFFGAGPNFLNDHKV